LGAGASEYAHNLNLSEWAKENGKTRTAMSDAIDQLTSVGFGLAAGGLAGDSITGGGVAWTGVLFNYEKKHTLLQDLKEGLDKMFSKSEDSAPSDVTYGPAPVPLNVGVAALEMVEDVNKAANNWPAAGEGAIRMVTDMGHDAGGLLTGAFDNAANNALGGVIFAGNLITAQYNENSILYDPSLGVDYPNNNGNSLIFAPAKVVDTQGAWDDAYGQFTNELHNKFDDIIISVGGDPTCTARDAFYNTGYYGTLAASIVTPGVAEDALNLVRGERLIAAESGLGKTVGSAAGDIDAATGLPKGLQQELEAGWPAQMQEIKNTGQVTAMADDASGAAQGGAAKATGAVADDAAGNAGKVVGDAPVPLGPQAPESVTTAANGGRLTVMPGEYSTSEQAAAEYLANQGNDVVLRPPVGTRAGGGTSDLLVNGERADVYTPITTNPDNIISAIAKKNTQAETIVLDLSNTSVTAEQLGNIVGRVQGAGATNIKNVIIIKK